jgi:GNAT superfamily N-acetyltransferase
MKTITVAKLVGMVARRRHEIVIRKDLTGTNPETRLSPLVTIMPIGDGVTASAIRHYYREVGQSTRSVAQYLATYRGFFLLYDTDVAGWYWYCDHQTGLHPAVSRFQIPLRDQEIFCVDFFVSPQFRGRGVGIASLTLIHRELRARGYVTAWGAVDAHNARARVVYKITGLKNVAEQWSWELFACGNLFTGPRVAVVNRPLAVVPTPTETNGIAHHHASACYNERQELVCYQDWSRDQVKFLREFLG